MTAAIVVSAGLVSRSVARIGVRLPLLVGPGAVIIGLAWLTRLRVTSGYLDLLGPLVIIALGMGTAFVPLTLSAVSGVAARETGLASALLNTTQQVGGALGLAVLATVAIDATKNKLQSSGAAAHGHVSTMANAVATTHGYTSAFTVASFIALAGFVISVAVIRVPRPPAATEPELDGGGTLSESAGIL